MVLLSHYDTYGEARYSIRHADFETTGSILASSDKLSIHFLLENKTPQQCIQMLGAHALSIESSTYMINALLRFAQSNPDIPKIKVALLFTLSKLADALAKEKTPNGRAFERQLAAIFKKEMFHIYPDDQEVAEILSEYQIV